MVQARARFDYVGNTSGPRAPQFPLQEDQKSAGQSQIPKVEDAGLL